MVKEEKKRKNTIDRQSLRLHVLSEDADDALSARQLQSFSRQHHSKWVPGRNCGCGFRSDKKAHRGCIYSTIFVRVMDSSYPSQDGGERET